MPILRDWHMTDSPLPEKGKRTRKISNWLNYRDYVGNWFETEWAFRKALAGELFDGLQLNWIADKMPLQFFVGHPSAAGNRPWWGVRRPHQPDTGIVMFLPEAVSSGYTVSGADKSATYEDVLPDTDLILYAGVSKLEKWIALLSPISGQGGTGDRVDVGFYLPDGWSLEVEDSGTPFNRIKILRPNGRAVYTSRPAYSVDADGEQVPTAFFDRGTSTLGGRTYHKVRVRCTPAGYTYPILMDPTVTISGTTDVEDNLLLELAGASSKNYGSLTQVQIGEKAPPVNNDERRGVFRINEAKIPSGTITDLRLHATRLANAFSVKPANLQAFRILPANDWVEGTASGAVQAGSSSWDAAKQGSQAWAGDATSKGCTVSGVDYEADATPPTLAYTAYTAGAAYAIQMDLDPDWATAWRDADYANEGIVIETDDHFVGTNQVALYSTESGTTPLYFEIDYFIPVPGWSSATRLPISNPLWAATREPIREKDDE